MPRDRYDRREPQTKRREAMTDPWPLKPFSQLARGDTIRFKNITSTILSPPKTIPKTTLLKARVRPHNPNLKPFLLHRWPGDQIETKPTTKKDTT